MILENFEMSKRTAIMSMRAMLATGRESDLSGTSLWSILWTVARPSLGKNFSIYAGRHATAPGANTRWVRLEVPAAALTSWKQLVGERGFEPPTPWSRTRFRHLLKSVEVCCFQLITVEPVADFLLKTVDRC